MARCLKVLSLLMQKRIAEIKGDKLEAWVLEGRIKYHIETCPDCQNFVEGMYTDTASLENEFIEESKPQGFESSLYKYYLEGET